MQLHRYLIKPGDKVDLAKIASADDGGLVREEAEAEFDSYSARLVELQELLYVESKHALIVVLQAMDGGGKDSTIRTVFGPVNPQGCYVANFKAPSALELAHDYLWRVHERCPALGHIAIFNRSHYEDVLIARVKQLVPEKRWKQRYDHINAFEELLHHEGTTVLKFFLHISKDYQRERLQRRLDNPKKWWKFNPADFVERQRWDDYQAAYQDALMFCTSRHAPWYVVPAERRWFRNLLITQAVVETLEAFKLQFPTVTFDPTQIKIE